MNLIECIILGISSLRRNPLRSALTILGIIVGVGSVVSMVSVGDGSSAMVLREIERTGGTKIIEIYKTIGTNSPEPSAAQLAKPYAVNAGEETAPKTWNRGRF